MAVAGIRAPPQLRGYESPPAIYTSPPESPPMYSPESETYRPFPVGHEVRIPASHRSPSEYYTPPHYPHPLVHRASFADHLVGQVLAERGLGAYVDPSVIRAAQLEIAEAYNMTPEQLDTAAEDILRHSPQAYEHLGKQCVYIAVAVAASVG